MGLQLRDYQIRCIENIKSKINDGAKFLSVAMVPGFEEESTSLFLAEELCKEKDAKIAMVFRHKIRLLQLQEEAKELSMEGDVSFLTVNEFVKNDNSFMYVILHDLSAFEREQVLDRVRDIETKTISFFLVGQELKEENVGNVSSAKRIMEYAKRIAPIFGVYATKEVLDIRDARYVSEDINEEICVATIKFEWQHKQMVMEIYDTQKRLQGQIDRLQAYLKAWNQRTKEYQAEEIERLKAEIQEKNEELEASRKEAEMLFEQKNQMISFQNDILKKFGIDSGAIQSAFDVIQKTREALKDDLEGQDEHLKEKALKELQDEVGKIVSELTWNHMESSAREHYEEYLIGALGGDVWDKLEQKSKIFLITAKSTYDNMVKKPDREFLDYSAICLLVAKALEVETTKRFFDKYKEYLKNIVRIPISQWPHALRKKGRGRVTDEVISDEEFTLGTIVPTIGLKRDYSSNTYSVGHPDTWEKFSSYAQNILFESSDRDYVKSEIQKDCQFIERVRCDYRNPAAHRNRINITTAEECIKYVIDRERMLRKMLRVMKI